MDTFVLSYFNPPTIEINQELFSSLNKLNYSVCGDLNGRTPVIGSTGSNTNGGILETIVEKSETIVISSNKLTFYRVEYSEVLDDFLSSPSVSSKITNFSNCQYNLINSDHRAIEVKFKGCYIPTVIATRSKAAFDFKKADLVHFKDSLVKAANSLNYIYQMNDVDQINKIICETIIEDAN
jgi:hypothetical protein